MKRSPGSSVQKSDKRPSSVHTNMDFLTLGKEENILKASRDRGGENLIVNVLAIKMVLDFSKVREGIGRNVPMKRGVNPEKVMKFSREHV